MDLEIQAPKFFYFEPLSFLDAESSIQELRKPLRDIRPRVIYNEWLYDFCRRSHLFYQAQFQSYRNIVKQKFYHKYNIVEGDGIDDYYTEWEDWSAFAEIDRYHSQLDIKLSNLEMRMNELKPEKDNSPTALVEVLLRKSGISEILSDLDAMWFEKVTVSPERTKWHLGINPYADYLKSDGWKRVRAAMILLYKARCQAEECYNTGDSWYGDEYDLNVHHVKYENLGRERFTDLTLLCRRHHERLHKGN